MSAKSFCCAIFQLAGNVGKKFLLRYFSAAGTVGKKKNLLRIFQLAGASAGGSCRKKIFDCC
jgi:hypothetical protein